MLCRVHKSKVLSEHKIVFMHCLVLVCDSWRGFTMSIFILMDKCSFLCLCFLTRWVNSTLLHVDINVTGINQQVLGQFRTDVFCFTGSVSFGTNHKLRNSVSAQHKLSTFPHRATVLAQHWGICFGDDKSDQPAPVCVLCSLLSASQREKASCLLPL